MRRHNPFLSEPLLLPKADEHPEIERLLQSSELSLIEKHEEPRHDLEDLMHRNGLIHMGASVALREFVKSREGEFSHMGGGETYRQILGVLVQATLREVERQRGLWDRATQESWTQELRRILEGELAKRHVQFKKD